MTQDSNPPDDLQFIEALATLLNAHDLSELTVKQQKDNQSKITVHLVRNTGIPVVQTLHQAPAIPPLAPAATAYAPPPAPDTNAAAAANEHHKTDNHQVVTSPMVGTVYMQPEPGQAPFVAVGDKVKEGQHLLIIEAMKTMNYIPAPHSGTITRIMVDDKTTVEFGTPLMMIED